jgi:hypothetical protein
MMKQTALVSQFQMPRKNRQVRKKEVSVIRKNQGCFEYSEYFEKLSFDEYCEKLSFLLPTQNKQGKQNRQRERRASADNEPSGDDDAFLFS